VSEIQLLIVDEDITDINIMKKHIIAEGYSVDEATDGIAALKLFRRNEYNLIILDTILPELDGKNVCRQIRKVSEVPIIIVSARSDEENKLLFFDLGVDDYIIKPFLPLELMARVKVFLRRSCGLKNIPSRRISFSGLHIDTISRTIYIGEKEVQLTLKEYELLLFLSQNPNKAFSRDELLNKVWGNDFLGSDRTIDTHIKTLRESLKPYHQYIATVWGYGYKFEV
jgi:DNA-binding response OmpR family regulator